jgi:hypothetical protein
MRRSRNGSIEPAIRAERHDPDDAHRHRERQRDRVADA